MRISETARIDITSAEQTILNGIPQNGWYIVAMIGGLIALIGMIREFRALRVAAGQPINAKLYDRFLPPTARLVFAYRKAKIDVDPVSERITFHRCHYSNRFWTIRADREFTCPLSDVLDVYYKLHVGDGSPCGETRIVTRHGKTMLMVPPNESAEEDLRLIREYLATVSAHHETGGYIQSPGFTPLIAYSLAAVLIAIIMALR